MTVSREFEPWRPTAVVTPAACDLRSSQTLLTQAPTLPMGVLNQTAEILLPVGGHGRNQGEMANAKLGAELGKDAPRRDIDPQT